LNPSDESSSDVAAMLAAAEAEKKTLREAEKKCNIFQQK
jgi:hypothetical protein